MPSRQHGSLDERWDRLLAQRGRSARLPGARGPVHKPRTVVVPVESAAPPERAEERSGVALILPHAGERRFESIDELASLPADHRLYQALAPADVQSLRSLLREFRALAEAAYRPVIADGREHAQMEEKIQAMSHLQSFLGSNLSHIFALLNRGVSTATST